VSNEAWASETNPDGDWNITVGADPETLLALYDDLGIGLGGVSSDNPAYNTSWILIGELMAQGPGGGNGGDSGDTGGNGQGWCGDKERRR
ncbi:MAG: hypothetical protein WBC49_01035, partial [Thermoplasmata archaeon]